jgi:hypothetical protein
VHRKASRLVERQDRVVFMNDVEIERDIWLRERRPNQQDGLTRPYPLAGTPTGPICAVGASLDDFLRSCARQSWNPMLDEPIQPLSGMLGRNGERK